MAKKPWRSLTVALASGSAAAYLAAVGLHAPAPQPGSAPAGPAAVVAARDLAAGSILRETDLRRIPWPDSTLPQGYVADPAQVVGRGIMVPLQANEPLLHSKLARPGSAAGLPVVIPPGYRAMSVAVDEVIAVAGFVVPRARVDVLATTDHGAAGPSTRLILQNVPVLASGQSMQPPGDGKPESSTVITLLVRPDQAEVLALAVAEGRIQLALRNALDQGESATPGSSLRALSGSADAVPNASPSRTRFPSRAGAPRAAVEIYSGSNRTVAIF